MGVNLRDDTSELLNVVREDGSLFTDDAGEILTVARGIAHTYGILHQTTNVLLISPHSSPEEVKVYLQKRSQKKRLFPSAWTISCGGHMGTSIDPLKAAVREAGEELGLSMTPDQLISLCDSRNGYPNLLKVWRYEDQTVLQMGSDATCFGFTPGSLPEVVRSYIEGIGLLDFPGQDTPKGLELEAFNREFCFYFLHFPSMKQIESLEYIDEEAEGLKKMLLADFLATPRCERTDSSETLIEHCPSLQQIISNNLP